MADKIYLNYQEMLNEQTMPNGKRQVLATGIKLFAENGFDGTSTAQIAIEAGVSQATIFKYFKTKKALLIAIVEPIIEQLFPVYRDEFFGKFKTQTDVKALIHFIVVDRFEFINQNVEIIKILLIELLTDKTLLPKVTRVITDDSEHNGIKEVFGGQIELMQQRGEIYPELSLLEIVRMIISPIFTYFLQTKILLPNVKTNVEHDLEQLEIQILRAISPKF